MPILMMFYLDCFGLHELLDRAFRLIAVNEPTYDAMINELTHGASQPSPSSAAVPINTSISPCVNTSVKIETTFSDFLR